MGCENKTLGKYCEISTCMGVPDWYLETHFLGKLFWAIMVIVGLGFTAFATYGTIEEFMTEDDYSTSITKEKPEGGIPFPTVTVCNFNRAKQSLIEKNKLDPNVLVYIFQLFPTTYDTPLWMQDFEYMQRGQDLAAQYEEAWKNHTMNGGETDIGKILHTYAHTPDDTFIQIVVGSRSMTAQDVAVVKTVYGVCHKIVPNFNQTIPGPFEGIKLNLNPQLDEYMHDVLYNNYFQQGFAISLNYDDEALMSDPIVVAPGSGVFVGMKHKIDRINFANYPLRPPLCNPNPVLTILKANYTPQNCIYDCYMQAVFEVCGCILLVDTDNIKYKKFCNLTMAMDCATPNLAARIREKKYNTVNVWKSNVYYGITNCTNKCINPCRDVRSTDATTTSTTYKIINRQKAAGLLSIARKLPENVVNETLDTGVMVKIYFTTSDVTVTSTGETTDVMTFIGNIGGQLGLLMGISLLSIIQLVYYVVVACLKGEFCCYRQRNQKTCVFEMPTMSKDVFRREPRVEIECPQYVKT